MRSPLKRTQYVVGLMFLIVGLLCLNPTSSFSKRTGDRSAPFNVVSGIWSAAPIGSAFLKSINGPTLAPFTVTNTNDSGPGSLRQAILDANSTAGTDTINFAIGSGPQTIDLVSFLPGITDPVIIDATTQPGFMGTPIIELNGTAAGISHALFITAGNTTVRGLVINRFGTTAIYMTTNGGNVIEGNFIGTDMNGAVNLGGGGITIQNTPNNRIGGTTAAARNVITNNNDSVAAIYVYQSGATGNTIQGNYIGINAAGTAALGGSNGVRFVDGATENTVGGTTPGARNVISGNTSFGVYIEAGGNTVQGNFIGTDATGNSAVGNSYGIAAFSSSNLIGGTTAGAGNVISGNGHSGIQMTSGNVLQGNFIGTNAAGNAPVPNGYGAVSAGLGNLIGGTTAAARNIISGNNQSGVFLLNNGAGTLVQGNYIGTDVSGTAALGNNTYGVEIGSNGTGSFNNTIGGTASGAGNVIAFNVGDGIFIKDHPNNPVLTSNALLSNSIFSNGGLGIDLGLDGVTANDTGDTDTGANNNQNFPVLISATTGGGLTTIRGTLNSTASTSFTLQFFSNQACDSSGNGEGETFVGSIIVTTDASGDASFTSILPLSVSAGNYITATATDPGNNTSEFSACAQVQSCAAVTLSPSMLPGGVLGTSYNQTITASGDTAPYTFNILSGALPPGLSLSSGGVISGTPTAPGNFSFTVTATGANGCTGSREYTITIGILPGTWSQQTSGTTETLRSVHFVNDNEGWAVGFNNTILHTVNGGLSWSPQSPPAGAPVTSFLAVRFADANVGWATGGRLVIRTTDGGVTWVDVGADASISKFRNSLFAVSQTVAWTPANSSGLPTPTRWFSRYTAQGNGSVTEEDFNVVVSGSVYLDMYFTDPDNGWAVGIGPIVRINNASGGSPSFSFQTSGTSAQLNAVHMLDTNRGWTVGNGGTILRTNDGGANWTQQTSGTTANLHDVHFINANRGWVVGAGGLILVTINGGQTWTPEASGTNANLHSVFFVTHGYAVGAGGTILQRASSFVERNMAADFDGDGLTDISVWQSDSGKWHIIHSADNSTRLQLWGQSSLGDHAVPGDYDGDLKTDIAIYRGSEGNWYILRSSDGAGTVHNWGGGNDRPVPADYDGDGRTDLAVYRPEEGNWYVLQSGGGNTVQGWGDPTDKLVPGDYDGDGKADVAVFRPTDGNWYIRKTSGGTIQQNWGLSEDRPVQGDYDGDRTTDIAVFRPNEGNWYIIRSTGGAMIRNWGDATDRPVPGDYDGDGKTDIAVWRPSQGTWYIIHSGNNAGTQHYLGLSTDTPIPSAYIP